MDPEPTERQVVATEHLDPGGSVVRSGIALADATLRALEEGDIVRISLKGLKGASSSYFNVFLRRIEEECGLEEIGRHILLEFGSGVQEMVFQRSLQSRGPRRPSGRASQPAPETREARPPTWKRIFDAAARLLRAH